MSFSNWQVSPGKLFSLCPVVPVLVIQELADVIPLAKALMAGGINILEVTLRTPIALDVIRLLKDTVPEAIVGAGTVTTVNQLQQVIEAGAQFTISPGLTRDLLYAGRELNVPFIPGASSISELMEGVGLGYTHFKFFPAEVAGGLAMLKAIHAPFPDLRFCATGGINEKNFLDYLSLPNVECVGGSWIVPSEKIREKQWDQITELASAAVKATG
ncbi:bifunctional 4-hydroxy-2-oxoglutarate aldolase/2-dehydro-3-deoxy-phosphogluconate aldolase [Legionella brunensis]|uniref:2-dehydro-3-deoxy-phosphogluconate aldolase n=1 Tax=Legionella brunensis TaxID=29422 RepID=A0A0W0STR8_9GAMM|nr:bifunctional 4-hydroxy-2-oxoglutarate aldolase/2-dehydro-3-deoxy-phosphogluconate aldolase [Legionella brunensis]KTC86652.1 2-deydro-3-deoxyphosphogluconate aldolase/4-hydroxy-2-oxoglutarate aldolase [Legionella brunensis]